MSGVGADDVTLGEVARRLDEMRTDMGHLRDSVGTLPDKDDLKAAAIAWHGSLEATEQRLDLRIDNLDRRLQRFESWETWGVRAVGLILLAAVLSLVLRGG